MVSGFFLSLTGTQGDFFVNEVPIKYTCTCTALDIIGEKTQRALSPWERQNLINRAFAYVFVLLMVRNFDEQSIKRR